MRSAVLAAVAALGLALAACGDTPEEIDVQASSEEQREVADAIAEELELYREPIDISSLPPEQQAQIGEALDQFPRAAGIVEELSFDGDRVTAATGLEPGDDSETTAMLICGAIIRGSEVRRGHEVLDSAGDQLWACRPGDANYP